MQARFEPMTSCVRVEHVWLLSQTKKSRCIRNNGINLPGSRRRGTGMNGIWEMTYFTGLCWTGHGNHGISLSFTGRVCTGSGLPYLNGTRTGLGIIERDHFGRDRDFWITSGPRDYRESRGIPRDFLNGKNPKERPGIFHLLPSTSTEARIYSSNGWRLSIVAWKLKLPYM